MGWIGTISTYAHSRKGFAFIVTFMGIVTSKERGPDKRPRSNEGTYKRKRKEMITMGKKFKSKPDKYSDYYTTEPAVQCTQKGYEHRFICQGCRDEGHVQLPTSEYHDCKMVFVVDGETCGQCCCYSKEHGKRGLTAEEWNKGLQED